VKQEKEKGGFFLSRKKNHSKPGEEKESSPASVISETKRKGKSLYPQKKVMKEKLTAKQKKVTKPAPWKKKIQANPPGVDPVTLLEGGRGKKVAPVVKLARREERVGLKKRFRPPLGGKKEERRGERVLRRSQKRGGQRGGNSNGRKKRGGLLRLTDRGGKNLLDRLKKGERPPLVGGEKKKGDALARTKEKKKKRERPFRTPPGNGYGPATERKKGLLFWTIEKKKKEGEKEGWFRAPPPGERKAAIV